MVRNLFIALAFLLTTTSCNNEMSGQKPPGTQTGKYSRYKKNPPYLLVFIANYAFIKETSPGNYQLILDHGDVEKILTFTVAPYRLVRTETA